MLVLGEIGRRQPCGGLPVDQPGEQRRDAGRRLDVDGLGRDRIERTAPAVGILGLVLGIEPGQRLASAFVDEVDEAEIPTGVADLDAGEMAVAVWNLEAAPLDDDSAVAFALHAVIGAGEGEAQRVAVGARPRHLRTREEARDGGLADLGVDLAVVLVLDPGLRRFVEGGKREIRHVLQHGDEPALDWAPERLLLGILVVMWPAT